MSRAVDAGAGATCPTCGGALERRGANAGEVTVGSIAAVADGATELACPDGHHAQPVRPDLTDVVLAAVDEALLVSRRTRVRRQRRCGACDSELTLPGRRTVRSVSTAVEGAGVVRVTFDLPMLRCPACGLEQLPAEVAEDDLPAAVRAALAPGSPGPPSPA